MCVCIYIIAYKTRKHTHTFEYGKCTGMVLGLSDAIFEGSINPAIQHNSPFDDGHSNGTTYPAKNNG
jgi:hypothetical protein